LPAVAETSLGLFSIGGDYLQKGQSRSLIATVSGMNKHWWPSILFDNPGTTTNQKTTYITGTNINPQIDSDNSEFLVASIKTNIFINLPARKFFVDLIMYRFVLRTVRRPAKHSFM